MQVSPLRSAIRPLHSGRDDKIYGRNDEKKGQKRYDFAMPLLQNTDAVELESSIPLDLYLHRVYRPDCDYIDGEVRERKAGYYPHSAMMVIVGAKLHEFAKATDTVALLSVRIRVSEDCVLVPDVCLARRTRPREDVIVTPRLLCVEDVAEADTFLAMQERVDRLLSMGVENVWLMPSTTTPNGIQPNKRP
jgi:hypothetical protein